MDHVFLIRCIFALLYFLSLMKHIMRRTDDALERETFQGHFFLAEIQSFLMDITVFYRLFRFIFLRISYNRMCNIAFEDKIGCCL